MLHVIRGSSQTAWPFIFPSWVPPSVARVLATDRLAQRLATDERMRRVWSTLRRRDRQTGAYMHPAIGIPQEAALAAVCDLVVRNSRRRAWKAREVDAERDKRIKAGGYAAYLCSYDPDIEEPIVVTYKATQIRGVQLTIADGLCQLFGVRMMRTAQTLTEVALECHTTRWAGRRGASRP